MKLVALLPVKPLHLAKSRLSGALNPEERQEFVRDGLLHTLRILQTVPEIWRTLVISADPNVWEFALKYEVDVYEELDVPGLNESVACGQQWALEQGADAVMVLPIDLPNLNADCLHSKILKLHENPGMVIVPDRHLQGTNFLLLSPPNLVKPTYGINSFERHCTLAAQAGVNPIIIHCADLALDIDSPEDLELLNDRQSRSNGSFR
jgi:2-phospho-L-lactate guanylyltransferase